MESKKFSLNVDDLQNLVKVAFYAGVSAALTVVMTYISSLEVDPAVAIFVPIVNLLLVAAKKYFDGEVE